MQGASAEQEAQRLRKEVEREQLNVKAALQALEAERARMAARAAAEKQRLLEKVGPAQTELSLGSRISVNVAMPLEPATAASL